VYHSAVVLGAYLLNCPSTQITEHASLLFTSNYALNKLLDKLPVAGPRWQQIEWKIKGNVCSKNGKRLTKIIEIWMCNILKVVKELLGIIAYGK
jgi:hypothetical protein